MTDANLLLGYLNAQSLVGGDLRLDRDGAEAAIAAVGQALAQDVTEAAYGIHLISNARMMRALSAVSSERGLDPSRFPIFAFGGNGGVHVCGLAEVLNSSRILVPPAAGLFSAIGLLFADVEHQCIRAYYQTFDGLDLESCNAQLEALRREADELLATDGYTPEARRLLVSAEVKYVGQNAALPLPIQALPLRQEDLVPLAERFSQVHEATFGYRSDREPLQFVSLKVVGQGVPEAPRLPERMQLHRNDRVEAERQAYFGPEHGWLTTPVISRGSLAHKSRSGPLIVEEYDCTIVVRPGWHADVDSWNDIVITRNGDTDGRRD